jgi:anti-sigma factor RsiW
MNSPENRLPDPFPRELIAGYVDGELDPADRARVVEWLNEHPEALAEVEAQRELSAANTGLWDRAAPPEPNPAVWAQVGRRIAESLDPAPAAASPSHRWRKAMWAVGGVVAAGLAAAIAWRVIPPGASQQVLEAPASFARGLAGQEVAQAPHPRGVHRDESAELIAGFAVLPIATDDDVVLERVSDTEAAWFPVGRHPLPPLLMLATTEEVKLEEVAPSPYWPSGVPRMTASPGDAPMLYATKPR